MNTTMNTYNDIIDIRTYKKIYTYSLEGTASPEVAETFQRSLLAAQLANKNGKVAKDAPPVNIGWDSHKPVVSLYIVWYFMFLVSGMLV